MNPTSFRIPQTAALAALILALASPALPSRADEAADKGRDIFNKNQHAVVTVEIVVKATYSSSGQTSAPSETRQEATGTVVDHSGLTVLSLSVCDPGEMVQRMMSEQSKYKVETEVSDVKILLDDGTELAAEVVLRDKDLDLAFIRPKAKPATPLAAVDFTASATAQMLDEVIALNRLNKAASRAYAASVERVSAVIRKPRTFYIPDGTLSASALGSPAFLLNGKILGVFLMRAVGSGGEGRFNYRQNTTAVILPAEDILKAAKQAPEAKGDAPKAEEPKAPSEPKDAKSAPETK
jgi:S1-C subfamily serine protease